MQRQEQTNTFQDGIISDMHPLSATNTSMTDALNATIVTYNGNEMILQNDMGNAKLYVNDEHDSYVQLTPGFKPLGVKEHGGILYIVSTDGEKVEIGSFPGPDLSQDNDFKTYALKSDEIGNTKFTTGFYDNVLPDLTKGDVGTIIEKSYLYKNIPLVYEDQKQNCILKVGQEYSIRVLVDNDSDNQISNKDTKKLYKLKFINLENDKNITENVKDAVEYQKTPNFEPYYYFPNIANVKLGVSFEFEDIDTFQLGQTLEIENDVDNNSYDNRIKLDDNKNPILDPDYNGARYPQLTNAFEVIFQTIEYKTQSYVQVSHFYIKWELISKIKRDFTEEEKKQLNGSFYGSLNSSLYSSFGYTDKTNENNKNIYTLINIKDNDLCIIKLPKGDNKYYLKYTIYPIWEKYSVFNCGSKDDKDNFVLNLHNDYKQTFSKWIISEEIDLELSPTFWGSKAKYKPIDKFNDYRYLSGDLFWSDSDQNDLLSIPLHYKGSFYYIGENGAKTLKINKSKQENSIDYVGCLNPSGDIRQVFPNVAEARKYQYSETSSLGLWQSRHYQALNLYEGFIYIGGGGEKEYLGIKKCRVHHFKHYNYISDNDSFHNVDYYNTHSGKFKSSTRYAINAQKMATRLIYGHAQDEKRLPHIQYGKQAFSPLCQEPKLNIGNSTISYNSNIFNSWKIIPVPGGGGPLGNYYNSNRSTRSSAFFGYNGKLNYNEQMDGSEMYHGWDNFENSENELEIDINSGKINLNIQNHIFALFAKNTGDSDSVDLNDINQDYTNQVTSFFQNTDYFPGYWKTDSRISAAELNDANYHSYEGGYISWVYTYDTKNTNIKLQNSLNQKIQLALVKSRDKDGDLVFLDSFDNICDSFESQKYHFISDIEQNIINPDVNKSELNIRNKEYKDLGYSTGILAPYMINTPNTFFNFVSLSYNSDPNKKQSSYSFSFENLSEGWVNIRFYLARKNDGGILNIKSENLKDLKIYIQSKDNEMVNVTQISSDVLIKENQYYLVQLIGKVTGSNIKIEFSKSGNDALNWYIRNILLFDQLDNKPFKTYAITTYSSSRLLFSGNENLQELGSIYCYLPEPNYFINQQTPIFTVNHEGYTTLGNELIQIIN